MKKGLLTCLTGSALLWVSGQTALAQVPPPAPPPPPVTLWRFLGIPQGVNAVRDVTTNRSGLFPEYERKPPLLRIADPMNLQSDNPAIKKAAEIKMEEDLAKQKIKALKYLGDMACGCYPGVEEALMAALDDCTEEVRYEAAKAIFEASGKQRNLREKLQYVHTAGPHEVAHEAYAKVKKGIHGALHCLCGKKNDLTKKLKEHIDDHKGKLGRHHGRAEQSCPCGGDSCCSEAVTKKLAEIVYERNGDGCYKEPSERVRAMAAEALRACCPNTSPFPYPAGVPVETVPVPEPRIPEREGVPVEPIPEREGVPVPPVPTEPAPEAEASTIFTSPVPVSATEGSNYSDVAVGAFGVSSTVAEVPEANAPATINEAEGIPASFTKPVAGRQQPNSSQAQTRSRGLLSRLPIVNSDRANGTKVATAAEAFQGNVAPAEAIENSPVEPAPAKAVHAKINRVNEQGGTVELDFVRGQLPAGYRMKVYRQFLLKRALVGEVEVTSVSGNHATARPVGDLQVAQLSRGDDSIFQPKRNAEQPAHVEYFQPQIAQVAVPEESFSEEPTSSFVEAEAQVETTEELAEVESAGPATTRRYIKPVVQAAPVTEADGSVFIAD